MTVYFAEADYQEQVDTDAPVRNPDRLKVEPFPSYPPPNYGDDYAGFKVFPVEKWLCVSRYADRGRTDRDGRPLLTARVALLDREEYDAVGRDVIAVGEFLRRDRGDLTATAFERYRETADLVSEEATFRRICRTFDRTFLADALSHILATGTARVHHADSERAAAFIRVGWNLLPWPFLSNTSVASDCRAARADDTEDVLLVAGPPRGEGGGGLFNRVDDGPVDLRAGTTPTGSTAALFDAVLATLLADEPWYDHGWDDQRRLLVDHVEGVHVGDDSSLTDRSESLARMHETVERVRDIETAGDDGWLP